jgi:hypothetical protein
VPDGSVTFRLADENFREAIAGDVCEPKSGAETAVLDVALDAPQKASRAAGADLNKPTVEACEAFTVGGGGCPLRDAVAVEIIQSEQIPAQLRPCRGPVLKKNGDLATHEAGQETKGDEDP